MKFVLRNAKVMTDLYNLDKCEVFTTRELYLRRPLLNDAKKTTKNVLFEIIVGPRVSVKFLQTKGSAREVLQRMGYEDIQRQKTPTIRTFLYITFKAEP